MSHLGELAITVYFIVATIRELVELYKEWWQWKGQ